MVSTRTPGPSRRDPLHSRTHSRSHQHGHRAGHAVPGPAGRESPRTRRGAAGSPRLSPFTAADLANATDELELLSNAFHSGMLSSNGKVTFACYGAKPETYHLEAYLRARDGYFGSTQAYVACKDLGRGELDAKKQRLRGTVEPNRKLRASNPRWQEAQDVFYAWVRRGYERTLGKDVNVPALILAGDSERLRVALERVSLRSGHEFKRGTFNPRPEKNPHGYRLGTISNHAFGTAIDVDALHNPQISSGVWSHIVAYAGAPIQLGDAAQRSLQWHSRPKDLFDAIENMSREFSARLKQALQEQRAEQPNLADDRQALTALRARDPHLAGVPLDKLLAWKAGFFALPWAVVDAMHEAQFRWGAVFRTVDLHHFELLPPGESQ